MKFFRLLGMIERGGGRGGEGRRGEGIDGVCRRLTADSLENCG